MLPARNLVRLAQLVQSEMTNTKTDEGPVVYTVPEVAAILKVREKRVPADRAEHPEVVLCFTAQAHQQNGPRTVCACQ
jgi:hypothetical protein